MPAATRIGDADVPHCSPMVRAEGSPNVFVNTLKMARKGDPVCCGSACATHSPDVFANGP